MAALRRWWNHNRLPTILIGLALVTAWGIRETQGAALSELYQWVAQPFVTKPSLEERIASAKQQQQQIRLAELEAENQKLRKLLGYVSTQSKKGVVAPVIGRSASHWWQQVLLGRGSQHGIRVGYIAADPGGLIGRVVQVTPNTSRVTLISDPTNRVGVVVSRSRFMGVMRGQGNNRAIVEFFNKDPNVRVGDTVSTSNFSQLFPPGMPVGRVVALNLNKSPAPEMTIELTAPFNFLETAIIYPYQPTEEATTSPPLTTPYSE
jgi:rod shape-determining protein MreC